MPLKYTATTPLYSFRPKYHAIIFTYICYIDCNLNMIEVSTSLINAHNLQCNMQHADPCNKTPYW